VLLALWFFLFPIAWLVATSFKRSEQYLHHPPIWIPAPPTLAQYQEIFTSGAAKAILNSVLAASSATLLSVLIALPAAYSLARYRTGGNFLPVWILSQRMAPPVALIVPIFIFLRLLHWVDTFQGLVLVYVVANLPFAVWILRSFIIDLPREIEESAEVDGANVWQILWRITVPLIAGGIAATALFCFIFSWTDFIFALVLTRVNVFTYTVYMTTLFGTMVTLWGTIGSMSTIVVVPMFVLVLAAQRYLVRGLTLGAIK
jgi:multiple sugar transport system permease protein